MTRKKPRALILTGYAVETIEKSKRPKLPRGMTAEESVARKCARAKGGLWWLK